MPEFLPILVLFGAGLLGGWIDAIAGGGGLITVPALLAAGLPPEIALGTNKLQSSVGTGVAVLRFRRAGLLKTPGLGAAVLTAFFSSIAGALAVSVIPPDLLRKAIPWILAALVVYTACQPRFGDATRPARLRHTTFALAFGLLLGFYDGFFGPGTGSFWTLSLVSLLGLDLRHATGYTKAANLASNLGALCLFASIGAFHLPSPAVMIAGQVLGARLGSGLAIRHGAAFIRPVFLAVVSLLTLRLLWSAWLAS